MASADSTLQRHARPLRMRLLLLAASGLLPLLIVLVWGFNHLVEERRVEAERSVLELSRALSTAVDAELRSVAALLHHMGTSDELERADLRAFHLSSRRTAKQLGWLYVVLADSEGRVLLRTNETYGESESTSMEPASMKLVMEKQVPVVSQLFPLPALHTDVFAVRVPVMRGGQLVYVLSAVLPTEKVQAVLTRQNVPAGWVSSVFDQTSHRIARTPRLDNPRATPSLQALLDAGDVQGVGRTVTHDGTENYTGYTRLAGSDWTVVVGTSVADTNEALRALLRAVALGVAGSLALAVLLAWVLSRRVLEPIATLKEGAAALGRGDPVELPPLDIVELDDVGHALTAAAQDRDRAAAQVNEALRQAEEASRSKDQFLAMLGHELRNPLAPIANAVHLMAMKGDDKTAQERRVIERQLVHVTRLVDDLLDVSRITSGRLTLRREPVRISQVLAQVVDTIRQPAYQHTVVLELAPGVEDAWVAGDEVRLVQVFNNLLVNAIKFTPSGGAVRVKAAVDSREVRIDVEDTGAGISPSELERVFDLFYQAPQSPDRARGGLGLGLPIVKSLIEMHGGSVQASSPGEGRGTCMTVRLPLVHAAGRQRRRRLAPRAARQRPRAGRGRQRGRRRHVLHAAGDVGLHRAVRLYAGSGAADAARVHPRRGLPGHRAAGHERLRAGARHARAAAQLPGLPGRAHRLWTGIGHGRLGSRGFRRAPHQAGQSRGAAAVDGARPALNTEKARLYVTSCTAETPKHLYREEFRDNPATLGPSLRGIPHEITPLLVARRAGGPARRGRVRCPGPDRRDARHHRHRAIGGAGGAGFVAGVAFP